MRVCKVKGKPCQVFYFKRQVSQEEDEKKTSLRDSDLKRGGADSRWELVETPTSRPFSHDMAMRNAPVLSADR